MSNGGRRPAARRQKVAEWLASRDFVRVADLAEHFRGSEITARRDLDALERRGVVERVHGGVRLAANHQPTDRFPANRLVADGPVAPGAERGIGNAREKQAIAAAAAQFVRSGATVFLSGGTTTAALFREIAHRDVRVITNNATIVGELDENTAAELFVLGGEYNRKTRVLHGDLTTMTLAQIHGDICFLSVNAISQDNGFTSRTYAAAAINRLMAVQCNGNVIVLADSSKIGITSNFVSLSLDQVRVLITDDGADPEELAGYRSAGIEVVVCPVMDR